jgi:tryptophan-rich sensory protein
MLVSKGAPPTARSPSPLACIAIASGAFIVPLARSASSSPSPNHPRILFWYWSLRKPFFKPKDWVVPVAWLGIEAALATLPTACFDPHQAHPEHARCVG